MQTGPTAEHVAENVRRIRTARGLSTNQLSALLARAGHPIAQSSISNIEAGRRRVDVDDLVALAVALDVNPSALLLPFNESGSIDLTGGGTVAAKTVWEWADGERPLRMPGTRTEQTEQWARFLRLARPASRRQIGMERIARELTASYEAIRSANRTSENIDQEAERIEQTPWLREDPKVVKALVEALEASTQISKDAVERIEEVYRQRSDPDNELAPEDQVQALMEAILLIAQGKDGGS
ncbi:hypothetical protein GCM10029992_12170 [Glycomyces albus]